MHRSKIKSLINCFLRYAHRPYTLTACTFALRNRPGRTARVSIARRETSKVVHCVLRRIIGNGKGNTKHAAQTRLSINQQRAERLRDEPRTATCFELLASREIREIRDGMAATADVNFLIVVVVVVNRVHGFICVHYRGRRVDSLPACLTSDVKNSNSAGNTHSRA